MARGKVLLSILLLATASVSAGSINGENGPQDIHRAMQNTGVVEIGAESWLEDEAANSFKEPAPVRDLTDKAFQDLAAKVERFHSISVLGDSYASGDGALNGWGEGACKRNKGSFGARLNNLLKPDSFQYLACSGAPVEKILNNQVNGKDYGKPDLVLLTAGGDNGGSFFHVLMGCILQKSTKKCDAALNGATVQADKMPESLEPLYESIMEKEVRSGHKREVIHLGYVQMYNRDNDKEECPAHSLVKGTDVTWASTGEGGYRDQINKVITKINHQIQITAKKYGIKFINVDPYFEGHRLCDGPDASWMQHRLSFREDGVICHPTFDGHGAYINATLRYLARHA